MGRSQIKRRSRTDIVADILRVAINGARISRIVSEANTNYNIAHEYLEMLECRELIRNENGLFVTTDKGKFFLERAKELKL